MQFKANKLLKTGLHLGIMASIVFVLAMIFFYYYLPNTTRHGESITVPSIAGMTIDEVEQYLTTRELRYQINDSAYSSEVKPHTVISQHPAPGSKVKQNRKIYITVSSKIPPLVKMPNLKDFSLRNAEMALKSYGLLMEVKYVPSPFSNLVLEQHFKGKPIEEGTEISKGSKIKLLVGNGVGEDDREIPNITGMPFDEAKVKVSGMDLEINLIREEFSPDHEPGTIIKQKPASTPDKKMKSGEVIDVWVAE
ncbi:PASTA domain-containing protein [Cytophagaceae bacterium ABcell3]|nr:PASTA domain-containing protein [Cytophagaceae bacterium ABcell3]